MGQAYRLSLFAGLLILVAALIYRSGLSGPLLFDDKPALTANGLVQIDGATFDEWRVAAFSSNSGPLRRPLAMISFAANHAAAGNFSPVVVKTTNFAIHLAIAVLVYFFCLAALQALAIEPGGKTRQVLAITAAAIWLLHPLNVSTVLYAVQRMAQLATLFTVLGLLVFMRYRQRWAEQGASHGELLAAGLWLLLLTTLAILSKENGALLPWLVVVLEVSIFRGVWAGRPDRRLRSAGWITLVAPLILVLAIFVLAPDRLVAGYAWREFTLEERVLTQARLLWRYLGWIIVPNINDMGFQHDDIPLSSDLFAPISTFIAVIAWPLTLWIALSLRNRFPLLLLAVLFFLVGHSMESTVIPLEMVYEHRNYLPAMPVCLLLAYVLVLPASQTAKISLWYPVLGFLAILSLLLFVRVHSWSDELTLSRTNLAQHPASSRSNYFYANALLRRYRRAEQLGLSDREKDESLLLSRHYFERMYQTNNRDMAALVMLYYLDSQYFTGLQRQVDWLAELEQLLIVRTLQPSDWNALAMLFDIFASESDSTSKDRVLGILDNLSSRYPRSAELLRYRYRYLAGRGSKPSELIPIMEQAQQLSPQNSWTYYYLLQQYAHSRDIASMYDASRLWLLNDPQRYSLHQLKTLFSATDTPAESSRD
jgi:hypothetical protein